MGGPKRASMREGPLAALFRKTEDGVETAEPQSSPAAAAPQAPDISAPETPAAPREERPPHPGLRDSATTPELPTPQDQFGTAPQIPTPQERLRAAFNSELPQDMLEPVAPMVVGDVYARAEYSAPPVGAQVSQPRLRVVGVGGAGVNAVNRMVEAGVAGVEFIAVNTDLQSLQQSTADVTVHIGAQVTRGLGSGADAELGRVAAMEEYDKLKSLLKGSDMVFITAGAGGGTGTGAAPVIARIAREVGALTVGIVTKPFGFEGTKRSSQAEAGIDALGGEVDTLIVVPNNRLLSVLEKQTSMVEAFRVADDVLRQGVQGVSDLVTLPGLINLDFADVRTVMSGAGSALLGIGMGHGEHRATDAAAAAVSSPLLETSMDGARSILLSITGGNDLSLWEVNEAAKAVSEAAHPDANIIFGAMVDENLGDQVWVTVVATGYGDHPQRGPRRLDEPIGEPRIMRTGTPRTAGGRAPFSTASLDVPEFVPRV
jgi:cell division protein FtsZ